MRGGSIQERSVIGSRADFSPERRGFLGATWCSLGNDGSYRLINAEQYHRSTIGDARYRNICSAVGQIFIAKIGDELRCASRESSHSISTYFSMIYVDIFSISQASSFGRSEEHTSELQSLMRISYAVFCL